jgi:hypothetical protein
VRELPVEGRGTEGEDAEPGVEGGAGPAPEPVEGERETTGGTTGEDVARAGEATTGEREAVRAGGRRTGEGPRNPDEVSNESAGVDARGAEGDTAGCVTRTD